MNDVLRARETLERRAIEKIAGQALDALALQLLLETNFEKRATRFAGAARFAMRASVGPILPPTPRMIRSPSARARSASSSRVGRVMNSSRSSTPAKPRIRPIL